MAPSNVQHQSLTTISVGNIQCIKLQGNKKSNNYNIWKYQMICLLESQDLLGFIDGKTLQPLPNFVTGALDESSKNTSWGFDETGDKELEDEEHKMNPEYVMWRRGDRLVKAWIIYSLTEEVIEVMSIVVDSGTAKDVWIELETKFSKPEVKTFAPEDAETVKDFNQYLELYRAASKGDWNTAERVLVKDTDAAKARINTNFETALHIAVSRDANNFVAKLLDFMPNASLAYKDHLGNTALHSAATAGNIEIARILIARNPDLLYIANSQNRYPVHEAARIAESRRVVFYFLSVTKKPAPYEGEFGLDLLTYIIIADFFDLALDLVNKYPYLATLCYRDNSALKTIAGKSSAFYSGQNVSFWERCIYKVPHQIKRIYYIKLRHLNAIRLVECLLNKMETLTQPESFAIYSDAMILASAQGTLEVIKMMVSTFPGAIHCQEVDHNIFHMAVKNRCENVYNLVYQMGGQKNHFANIWDNSGNSLLHLCAKLAPPHKLNLVSGAALQMQRELQWFKEIESFIPPSAREAKNHAGKTPQMIFTEEHKGLKEEGEKWMINTATSCILVATLIVTVVFAAAITVPGGNDQYNGVPIWSKQTAFIIFAVSDALSLFTSTTSLLLFLSPWTCLAILRKIFSITCPSD